MSNSMGNITGKPLSSPRPTQNQQEQEPAPGSCRQGPRSGMANGSPSRGGPARPDRIPSYLDENGYVLGEILGEGSYSKVKACTRYSTIDGLYMHKLACKIIDKCRASDDFVTKFLPRELQTVRELNHANIVRVWDIVNFQDYVYLFMDFCDGGDLLEYVKAKGHISENRSRHYFRQLVSAVRYLHNQDIAHRDLKCENILMTSQDQIKISDFGFARYCHNAEGKRILSNTYCGSAAYAAPEILQGTSYNPKLYDCWSIGCVLFIMITGHMPFDESDIPAMLKNQLERRLIFPPRIEEQVSISAKILIRRLLEPDVTRRGNIEVAGNHEWTRLQLGYRPVTSPPFGDGDPSVSTESSPRRFLGDQLDQSPTQSPRGARDGDYSDLSRQDVPSCPAAPAGSGSSGQDGASLRPSYDGRRRHIGSRGAGGAEGGQGSRVPRTGTAIAQTIMENKVVVGRRR